MSWLCLKTGIWCRVEDPLEYPEEDEEADDPYPELVGAEADDPYPEDAGAEEADDPYPDDEAGADEPYPESDEAEEKEIRVASTGAAAALTAEEPYPLPDEDWAWLYIPESWEEPPP